MRNVIPVIGEIATNESIKLGTKVTNCIPNTEYTFVAENGNATIFKNILVSMEIE